MTANVETFGALRPTTKRNATKSQEDFTKITRMLGKAEDEIRALRSENLELRDEVERLRADVESAEDGADLEAYVDAVLDKIERVGLTEGDRRDLARNGVAHVLADLARARGRTFTIDPELGPREPNEEE